MPKIKSKIVEDLVCSECGSSQITVEVWINPNRPTTEVTSDDFIGSYCKECEKDVEAVLESEFEKSDM